MTIITAPHLNFRGNARDALGFYQSVFGGHQTVVTYEEAGAPHDPAEAGQVIWGQVVAENGFTIMAYDVPALRAWNPGEAPFFVSVRGPESDEIARFWVALAQSATIIQPLGASGWSPLYGMLKDRFGITWVLDVEVAYTAA